MNKRHIRTRQLIALFIVGLLLFNYPLLLIFNQDSFFLGIPVLYFYLFLSWVILIIGVAVAVERSKPK